jgi:hypothetical protein
MSGGKFGPVKVVLEDGSEENYVGHSLSTGWFVGYGHGKDFQKKIPRDRIKEVRPWEEY